MPSFNNKCINAALEKLVNFKKGDLEDYYDRVLAKSREYKNLTESAAISRAVEDIGKEVERELFDITMVKGRTAAKYDDIALKFSQKKADLANVISRDDSGKNLSFSIESNQHSVRSELNNVFHDDLSSDEMAFLVGGKSDMDIAKAIDGGDSSAMAKKIASKNEDLVDDTNRQMVSSDAMPLSHISKSRNLNTTHDRSRMLRGGRSVSNVVKDFVTRGKKYTTEDAKELWMGVIKPKLNLYRTFERTNGVKRNGELNHARIDQILSNVFDNIINETTEIFTRSSVENDKEAQEKRLRMFFHWESSEGWMAYNKQYGSGSYYDCVQAHIRRSAGKIGAANVFGDSPASMYLALRKKQMKVEPKSPLWMANRDLQFKATMGIHQIKGSATLASFISNLNSLTGMARTATVALLSQTDVASSAAFGLRHGTSYAESFGHHLAHIMGAFPTEERKYIASQFKLLLDSNMGYTGRFIDATSTSKMINKAAHWFYKWNGAHLHDYGTKQSAMTVMAKQLSNFSHESLENVPEKLNQFIKSFDITPKEWDLLRNENKRNLFALDNVTSLSKEKLRTLYDDPHNKNKTLYQIRNSLHNKVFSMFDVASEHAITTPSTFTRAMMTRGTTAGDPGGALVRLLAQFKGYPYQFMQRVWIQGLKNADTPMAKTQFALSLLAGTMPMAWMADAMLNIANGKSIPDPRKMNAPERMKWALNLAAGNFGTFMRLMDNQSQNTNSMIDVLSSPSTKFLSNLYDTLAQTAGYAGTFGSKKQLKMAKKSAVKAATYIFPSSNIPLISPFMRNMFGQKTYIGPGQRKITKFDVKQFYGK